MHTKKYFLTLLSVILLCTMSIDAEAAKKKKKKPVVPPPPALGSTKDFGIPAFTYDPNMFEMQLGVTSFEGADKIINKEGGKIIEHAYGETNANIDTLNAKEQKNNSIVNQDIILVDFIGLPLESFAKGRMGFLKNKMYFLYYEFDDTLSFEKLEKQVVAKYGKPHKIGGFPDRFLEWKFANVVLTLKDNFVGSDRMIFTHTKLLTQAHKSNQEIIKEKKKQAYKNQRAF